MKSALTVGVKILVSAGLLYYLLLRSDLDAVTDDVWQRLYQVNVVGAFHCARASAVVMRETPAADGAEIIVELWDVPQARFGEFVAEIPPPLGIGNLELADGRWVKGFICEPYALDGARDITSFGGWRAFIASTQA